MGQAWCRSAAYPWETTRYVSGIEVVKVNITLRIYSAKWHVYAGLAMLNPIAQAQIRQYAKSTTELFKLMVENKGDELAARVWDARERVFGWGRGEDASNVNGARPGDRDQSRSRSPERQPILLSEDVLDQFSLGGTGKEQEREKESPNSHLSLLAMVDCWSNLGIRPYEHLAVAGTPVFMLWIGASRFLSLLDLMTLCVSYRIVLII
jgi:prephenate dehydrogenase (NADP+)